MKNIFFQNEILLSKIYIIIINNAEKTIVRKFPLDAVYTTAIAKRIYAQIFNKFFGHVKYHKTKASSQQLMGKPIKFGSKLVLNRIMPP